MSIGDLAKYQERIYQISEVRNNPKGTWFKLSQNPADCRAEPARGTMADCWFLSKCLEVVE